MHRHSDAPPHDPYYVMILECVAGDFLQPDILLAARTWNDVR